MKSQGPNKTPNSDNSTGLGLDQLPEKLDAQTALLARQLAPILLCDKNEPFKPVAVGITHLRPGQPSPSFGHINPATQAPTGTDSILEYEIWWDGDIQHLYELEHVWIYLDENNAAIHVTASAHGKMLDMSQSIWQDRQVRLFCEPGKHAHSPTSAQVIERREALDKACSDLEGVGDILVQPFFAQQLAFLCPYDHYLAFDHLRNLRFKPTYSFEKSFDLSHLPFMSWRELNSYIPRYLREQTEMLRRTKKGVKAIFVDSGDTLIDEGSQLFSEDRSDLVLSARPIDTSRQLINELKERGYLVALVADGLEQSFRNVLRANGFWDHFDAMAISENCGVSKPHPRMFQEAMLELGLRPEDAEGIIMLGNNLARDIRGANALGLTSVWIDWVDRYDKTPKDDIEKPDFTISKPIELLEVIEKLEQ